jgi:hypothetical protein
MVHTDVINIVSANENKFGEVYDNLKDLEVSCEMIADSTTDELERSIDLMIVSLLKFKTSKFELLADSIGNIRNSGSEPHHNPDNADITSAQSEIN